MGYSLKAALRSVLLVLGSVLLLLVLLSHAGFITVNWRAVYCSIENVTRAAGEFVSDLGSQDEDKFGHVKNGKHSASYWAGRRPDTSLTWSIDSDKAE